MYLLILFAFLHAEDPAEHAVAAHYATLDACLIRAAKLNLPDVLRPRQPGDVWICAKVIGPT